jgi:hypothetical protein
MTYWLSTLKMTVYCETDNNGIIIESAPIIKKFIGKPLNNLELWMKKQGEFIIKEL